MIDPLWVTGFTRRFGDNLVLSTVYLDGGVAGESEVDLL